ncbi:MAG: hypothetical protein DIU78_000820 [Pseudomonadota bacterium]|nr:MAG: hypothetical protein DIU78_02520 [Pseudomonadota bacterium]
MGELLVSGDGGDARCFSCGALAVGPCARCHKPLCGDCCVLTEGGVTTFAVCRPCARSGAGSLRPAWRTVLGWILTPLLLILGAVLLLEWLFASR